MKIILDAMGGDNAPGAIVLGAIDAIKESKNVKVYLVGKEALVKEIETLTKEECEESFRKFITKESLTVSFVGDVKQFKFKI